MPTVSRGDCGHLVCKSFAEFVLRTAQIRSKSCSPAASGRNAKSASAARLVKLLPCSAYVRENTSRPVSWVRLQTRKLCAACLVKSNPYSVVEFLRAAGGSPFKHEPSEVGRVCERVKKFFDTLEPAASHACSRFFALCKESLCWPGWMLRPGTYTAGGDDQSAHCWRYSAVSGILRILPRRRKSNPASKSI